LRHETQRRRVLEIARRRVLEIARRRVLEIARRRVLEIARRCVLEIARQRVWVDRLLGFAKRSTQPTSCFNLDIAAAQFTDTT
jgi:hypothetical protein